MLAVIISFLTNKLDVSIIHIIPRILRTINIRPFRRSNASKGVDSFATTMTWVFGAKSFGKGGQHYGKWNRKVVQ